MLFTEMRTYRLAIRLPPHGATYSSRSASERPDFWLLANRSMDHKIGIRAAVTPGRIGYAYPTGNRYALIVRNFFVNPSGEYADVPWTEPDDRGYSTQACSVNSRWGEFSEMEYHVPAIGGGTGLHHIEDRSQLWAFRGSRKDIESIAHALLSSEI